MGAEKFIEREVLPSNFWTEKMEEGYSNENELLAKIEVIAERFCNLLEIPTGAFSGVATYFEDGKEKRISPKLDKLMAEMVTNQRFIVKDINEVGPVSTKDPREKYEGEIDAVLDQLRKDFKEYKEKVEQINTDLEHEELSSGMRERANQLLRDALEVYSILEGELELKKRGFENIGVGEDISLANNKIANKNIEIKYLSGGHIVILRGYVHHRTFQEEFGGSGKNFGLAQIYKNGKYIAIEGLVTLRYGISLGNHWIKRDNNGYGDLMRALVEQGCAGNFLELDSRYWNLDGNATFNTIDLDNRQAQVLFNFVKRINPKLAGDNGRIKTVEEFKKYFHTQRDFYGEDNLYLREAEHNIDFIRDGTYYHQTASIDAEGKTKSYPTGFELGQFAFTDALSVIKMLILGRAMHKGEIEPGILVDFQGAKHLSYKSYFFDNPQYAMTVVLTNIWEILASHPNIRNREHILEQLGNLNENTWKWVLDFIVKVPLTSVALSKRWKKNTDPSPILRQQRLISDPKPYSPFTNFSTQQRATHDDIIRQLTKLTSGDSNNIS